MWLISLETLWNCFRPWIWWLKLWPLRMACSPWNINVWRRRKIIQTKHLNTSVAQKQVCVPWRLQMRRCCLVDNPSHILSSLISCDLTAPRPSLSWAEPGLTAPTTEITARDPPSTLLWTAPGAVSPVISDSVSIRSIFRALSSQGVFILGDVLTRLSVRCHAWGGFYSEMSLSLPPPPSFSLPCPVSAVFVVGSAWALETEFKSQLVVPLSDCAAFHMLLQISESQALPW